ncbi:uncharacterized protein LOC112599693 [Melanaphis sacchari]|uniref:uncharacterized protein LOC112599693 n=1 Tax=Melanaphis sacchari TaxID=742174 RepID=UPI000DC13BC3|nr:uncharacterized protein LOC112599693 [Melanaphis sacchari]XP_025202498.1 uncharacterized protein LOC112599693 [Melanaphis sacchari]XP_025202499.1 uncharacterized protein LOC112599693 [Melanaphis sacchari]
MECRRTVITSGVLRSPPSASAAPLSMATSAGAMRHRGFRHSRSYDCGDEVVDEYNNNSNVIATTINNTTQLVDELEQLRTDNFQLRLRVYNAERRVDKLSAAALDRDREKRSNNTDSDTDDSSDSSGHSDTDRNNAASAKATAEAAVRTIHDLLTVNRRLLALLAATVSAKAVSVSADDKRRWRRLRKHIEKYAVEDPKEEKTDELDDDDDEFHDASTTDSETSCKAQVAVSAESSATRQNVLRSPSPLQTPSSSTPLKTTVEDDENAGSEVSRLRGRCRRLERSLQQLVNTELWARNRQIGKLEQQRYVTQVANATTQSDRRPTEVVAANAAPLQQHCLQQFSSKTASAAPLPVTKGILVKRLSAETPIGTTSTADPEAQNHRKSPPTVVTITTPPPVLPDYSEVNFFFSCDEEDDDGDSVEMNTSSSSKEEAADSNDCSGDEEPVRLGAIGAPVSSASARKRHCRPHHRQLKQPNKSVGETIAVSTSTSSSSTESAAEDEANDSNCSDGVIATTTAATSHTTQSRTVSGGGGLHRRRRCRPPRRCSTCGRCSGIVDAESAAAHHLRPPSVTDAQVQCGDGNVQALDHGCSDGDSGGGEHQLQLLRRELDTRRRENGRLYDMLLKLQRGTRSGDRGKGDGGPRIPSPDFSDSDLPSGSPEPHRRAAGTDRGRVADLLPPLLCMRSISDDDDGEGHQQRDQPDGAEQQQQQQLMLLTRLRERIVAYERRELNGGDDRVAGMQARPDDTSNDAVRRMDRADLVNVALPRVVERLRQALVPLLQRRSENAAPVGDGSADVGGGDAFVDGARPSSPANAEGR